MSCRDSQPPRKEDAAQTESQTGSSQGDGHRWWALLLILSYGGLEKGNARKGTAAREPDIWELAPRLPQRSPTGRGLTRVAARLPGWGPGAVDSLAVLGTPQQPLPPPDWVSPGPSAEGAGACGFSEALIHCLTQARKTEARL